MTDRDGFTAAAAKARDESALRLKGTPMAADPHPADVLQRARQLADEAREYAGTDEDTRHHCKYRVRITRALAAVEGGQ